MDKKDILKYNGMIAEFLKFTRIPDRYFIEMNPKLIYFGNMDKYGTVTNLMSENDLKYHCSMDWLLPVINRIKFFEQVSITSDNSNWECAIESPGYHYATQAFEIDSDLVLCVWRACVEYINKVNTNTLTVAKK